MYLYSSIIVILLSISSYAEKYHFDNCLSCTGHGRVYLRPLFSHSNHSSLCINNANGIPISSSIIVFAACDERDCFCVHKPSKAVVNKKLLCNNNYTEVCTLLHNKSNLLYSTLHSILISLSIILIIRP